MLVTTPDILDPIGNLSNTFNHGSSVNCLIPRDILCVSSLNLITFTCTDSPICKASEG